MKKVILGIITLGVFVLTASGAAYWTNRKKGIEAPNSTIPGLKSESTKDVSGILLSGHDKENIELLANISDQISDPKTIVLAAPTSQGTKIFTKDSNLSNAPDKAIFQALQALGAEQTPIMPEKNVEAITKQIASIWPKATVIPILFPADTGYQTIEKINESLTSECSSCLLIAATNISRDVPPLLANLHNVQTERALKNRDSELLFRQAEVDSPSALTLLTMWAKSQDSDRFHIEKKSNTAEIMLKPDDKTVTSILGWYENGEFIKPEESVTFLVGGDMMFGRNVAHHFLFLGKDLTTSFEKFGNRMFWGLDVGIANLEGPVSDVPVPDNIQPNNFVFNFPPETISVLKYLHLDAVSLANNHTHNKGNNGLTTTRRLLDEAGIKWIGGPTDGDVPKTECFSGETIRLCIIGVHLLATQPDLSPTIKKLKAEPNTRVLIFPHWGAEYQATHGASAGKLAHAWIDAGADIVIGAHPHWIQDAEVYKGRPIFYSLGNLLFDQDFSVETQQGLLIGGKFTQDNLEVFALPVQSTKHQPALASQPTKGRILDTLYKPLTEYKKITPAGDIFSFSLR